MGSRTEGVGRRREGGRNQGIRGWDLPQGKWAGTRREGGWKQEGMGENQEQRCRNYALVGRRQKGRGQEPEEKGMGSRRKRGC